MFLTFSPEKILRHCEIFHVPEMNIFPKYRRSQDERDKRWWNWLKVAVSRQK